MGLKGTLVDATEMMLDSFVLVSTGMLELLFVEFIALSSYT